MILPNGGLFLILKNNKCPKKVNLRILNNCLKLSRNMFFYSKKVKNIEKITHFSMSLLLSSLIISAHVSSCPSLFALKLMYVKYQISALVSRSFLSAVCDGMMMSIDHNICEMSRKLHGYSIHSRWFQGNVSLKAFLPIRET